MERADLLRRIGALRNPTQQELCVASLYSIARNVSPSWYGPDDLLRSLLNDDVLCFGNGPGNYALGPVGVELGLDKAKVSPDRRSLVWD